MSGFISENNLFSRNNRGIQNIYDSASAFSKNWKTNHYETKKARRKCPPGPKGASDS